MNSIYYPKGKEIFNYIIIGSVGREFTWFFDTYWTGQRFGEPGG